MVRSSLVLSLAAAASSVLAATDAPAQDIVPGAYIIEIKEGQQDPRAVYNAVEKEGKTRLKLDFELFKGVSVQMDDVKKAPKKAAEIANMPAVKNMWPVRLYNMPNPKVEWIGTTPRGPAGVVAERRAVGHPNKTGDSFSPHTMTQVDRLRAKGITGKGAKIAIIDTGIDYKHPALGGCFGKGCLVSFGTDLVGDNYNGSNTPVPDNDPMDCGGHGTHVAGIVAAQAGPGNSFGFTGAAPDATLGAYRVFGCKGQVSNDVLIAAYNRAFQDGANIITASIGGPSGWSEDPWAVAVSRIVERGVPCTVSAGNEGDQGLFYASGAADAKKVIGVASFDNTLTPTLLYGVRYAVDGGDDVGFGYVPANPQAWDKVTLDLWATSLDPAVKDDACSPLPAGGNTTDLASKIVLIRRGSCPFTDKATNAAARGARYIMFYNNVAGALSTDLSTVPRILAGGMATAEVGEAWVAALRAGKRVTLKMASRDKAQSSLLSVPNNVTGGALSTYTSWGPSWEMDLKPQVGTPGGNILSTYPRALGSYAVLSGTSMACPLAAGIVALVAQVRGTFDPALIENLLSATSRPQRFNDGAKFYDYLAPAAQQGGGLVRAFDAAYATTLLEPSGLSFNDTDHFVTALNFTLSNRGSEDITYRLSHVPAVTMYTLKADGSRFPAPFPNDAVESPATVRLSEDSVRVAPGQSACIDVLPTPPQGLDAKRLALWSGWIAVNGSDGSSLSIPYQGLTGSLHATQVLGAADTWIAHSTDTKLKPVAANTTFTLPGPGNAAPGTDLPALVANLALGSPRMRADIVPLTTCPPNMTTEVWGVKTIGQPFGFPSKWNTRGPGSFPWDGRLDSGNYAPPGKYKFVVRALRIFGNAANKAEWDVSESAAVRIKYA
ncbi:subtilase family protein [Hirsutella rhossiliensis]|uniref:Subtilase family domain-containing protein n=1 Tax=Hirsutella rhossiliensis TaxID=111463 RepID=A0A9P8N3A6_9HYPO|nr:subtilase family domain-containing protein [Hirsutella rhossiliensis]KAH0966137.1 subtilase family domain-containing protein [Hirsutella rhossiliensis]